MAKSLRSKWRRKCRAVKREKYGVKELAQLKKTLGITDDNKPNKDEIMEEINTITLSVDADTIKVFIFINFNCIKFIVCVDFHFILNKYFFLNILNRRKQIGIIV